MQDGTRRIIAPWQMADPELAAPDWPRADLNLACLELLIGLVFMADPPLDKSDWRARRDADPERLRARLAPFASAFDLMGDGPRFLQDLEVLQGAPTSVDMLFIDSAGGQTAKNNADLLVHRDRYGTLTPALAAMALYTFQAFAPSGGAGNRTSMRGGGPMVTLVQPPGGLWDLIWANVPDGTAAALTDLPWMRPTRTSEKGGEVYPAQAHPVEAFFGMPRRLRLCGETEVTGVIQRPYGTNYAGWDHPLSPYYAMKVGGERLPKHPKPGAFGYRQWLGIVAARAEEDGLSWLAGALRQWKIRAGMRGQKGTRIIVGGWAMSNMKPLDFILSMPPLVELDRQQTLLLSGMVDAADKLSFVLNAALSGVLSTGEARAAVREAFYQETQAAFEARAVALQEGGEPKAVAEGWLNDMRRVALPLFETRALPGLGDREARAQKEIVAAHRGLIAAFAGRGKLGEGAYLALVLEPPPKPAKSGKQKKEVAP